jgi:hypothetical protein
MQWLLLIVLLLNLLGIISLHRILIRADEDSIMRRLVEIETKLDKSEARSETMAHALARIEGKFDWMRSK